MLNQNQFKNLETEKEMLMASNRSLAEFNLSKQPELEEGKQILKELSEQANQLCTSVRNKLDEMRKLLFICVMTIYLYIKRYIFTGDKSGTMTVDTALDLLQAAAAEIEEESEVHIKYFYTYLIYLTKVI